MTQTKEIQLFQQQDLAIFSPQRFKAYVGGLQSGKTISGAIWSRIQFDKYPNDSGLISAPTYKILEQSTLPKFFEINPDLRKYYKKQAGIIEVPNRGIIYIRSTENPNVIEGMTLRWIWADEAGQMKVEAWINFQGRISILKGSLFCTTTPYSLNWLYTDFYKQWKDGNKDYIVVQCRSCENPYFPKEEYERVKATMDGRVFRRRYDGIFEKMEGLVYEDFNINHIIEPKVISFKEVIAGIDWGYTNQAAIAVIGIDNDNCFYIIDEYYQSGKTTAEIIERLKYFTNQYKIRFYYPDSAEPDRLEEMRRAGLHPREVIKGSKSIQQGIDSVREIIRQNRFKVFNTCKYTLDELSLYHYPESKEEATEKEEPLKENDHLMDAIRYAIHTYQPSKKPYIKRTYQSVNSITGY
jgi:PBSX family phage terminase large subunit